MAEEKRSRWRKLDNAALAFPAATGKKDTRFIRFFRPCCVKVCFGIIWNTGICGLS